MNSLKIPLGKRENLLKDSFPGYELHINQKAANNYFYCSYEICLKTDKKVTTDDKGKTAGVTFGKCKWEGGGDKCKRTKRTNLNH